MRARHIGGAGTFNLDALGNRIDRDSGDYFGNDPNFEDVYTVNDENEYTAIQNNNPPPAGTFNPVYDNNGNMELFQSVPGRGARAGLRSTVDAEYDAYSRPYYMEVTETGGLNEDYRYGPTGLLFQFMKSGTTITEGRRYVYDGSRIVAEYVFEDDQSLNDPAPTMRLDRTHIHGALGEPVHCAVDGNGDRDLQDNRNHLQWDDYPSGPAPADRLPIDFEWYYAPSHQNGAIYALLVEDPEEEPPAGTFSRMSGGEEEPPGTGVEPAWYASLTPFTMTPPVGDPTPSTKVLEYYIYSPDTTQFSPPYQETSPSSAHGRESTPWTLADNNSRDLANRVVVGDYAYRPAHTDSKWRFAIASPATRSIVAAAPRAAAPSAHSSASTTVAALLFPPVMRGPQVAPAPFVSDTISILGVIIVVIVIATCAGCDSGGGGGNGGAPAPAQSPAPAAPAAESGPCPDGIKRVDLVVYDSGFDEGAAVAVTAAQSNGATSKGVTTVGELMRALRVGKCECIRNVLIISHGQHEKGGVKIGDELIDDSRANWAGSLGSIVKQEKCKGDCSITLLGCETANQAIAVQRMQKESGCKVIGTTEKIVFDENTGDWYPLGASKSSKDSVFKVVGGGSTTMSGRYGPYFRK
jgi:hypothetical protein